MAVHVKVVNDGDTVYTDQFNGRRVEIPVKGFIKMQRREAIQFLSQMSPTDPKDRNRLAEKRLRMEVIKDVIKTKEPDTIEFVCNLDGKKFDTQKELDEHLANLSDRVAVKDDTGNIKRKVAA